MNERLRLPLLSRRQSALETCAYCPKLCRASCPVSNAEPKDSLTPWGKMTLSWFAARGDLPVSAENASVAWACTGCFACRERCDHKNPTAETLFDARADFLAGGAAPDSAQRALRAHEGRVAEAEAILAKLRRSAGVSASGPTALVIGCSYLRQEPEVSRAALEIVATLAGPVRLIGGCCGAPQLYAGDRRGFERSRAALRQALADSERVLMLDPGCALAVGERRSQMLVEFVAQRLNRLSPLKELAGQSVRWHDPCQLGRGLGLYKEPRRVLARVLGRAPEEFPRNSEAANCSGAGGLLPVVMPDVSRRIADARLAEHEQQGGGLLVTACASSLRRFRSRGAQATDLTTLIQQSLSAGA